MLRRCPIPPPKPPPPPLRFHLCAHMYTRTILSRYTETRSNGRVTLCMNRAFIPEKQDYRGSVSRFLAQRKLTVEFRGAEDFDERTRRKSS